MSYSMISAEKMTKIFQPGEVVFEDGSKGSHMYLVIAGTVNIVKSTEQGQALLTTTFEGAPPPKSVQRRTTGRGHAKYAVLTDAW